MDHTHRLLIAEEHEHVRRELAALLSRRLNLQLVGMAGQADETLALVAEVHPDIVLLDGRMPNSLAVCQTITTQYPTVKVIIMAAHGDEQDRHDAYQVGAYGYFLKDLGSQELVQTVHALCD